MMSDTVRPMPENPVYPDLSRAVRAMAGVVHEALDMATVAADTGDVGQVYELLNAMSRSVYNQATTIETILGATP